MRVYLDTSVLLRVALGQPDQLPGVAAFQVVVTSALTRVEALRTLDRRWQQGLLDTEVLAAARASTMHILAHCDEVLLSSQVLGRAAEPFPTPLGTLDALHLASALGVRDAAPTPLHLATHDRALALAARSMGLRVVGC